MAVLELFMGILLLGYGSCDVLPTKQHKAKTDSPPVDPEVLQFLTQLFEKVKESGRKPVDGELNLLPDESKGFANVVRCFPDTLGESGRHHKNKETFQLWLL